MIAIAIKFGYVIRANRESRGLPQEALAELANLNRSYLERDDAEVSAGSW